MLTRKVLLLNASYEPLGIVTIPRAVRLVWKDSAEVVELDGDRVLRSQRFTFPCPSVIRLVAYVNVRRYRGGGNMRTRIFLRDRYMCQYCGIKSTATDASVADPTVGGINRESSWPREKDDPRATSVSYPHQTMPTNSAE